MVPYGSYDGMCLDPERTTQHNLERRPTVAVPYQMLNNPCAASTITFVLEACSVVWWYLNRHDGTTMFATAKHAGMAPFHSYLNSYTKIVS